jgi:hypothetical protein
MHTDYILSIIGCCRMEAEAERDILSKDLNSAKVALEQEVVQRQHSEAEAARLALQGARLSNALEIERLIK